MSEPLTAAELVLGDLAQALPLLRVTWPKLGLSGWQAFAADFCAAQKAEACITGLFDNAGGLCGLLASRVDHILGTGRVLTIPVFTAIDIANSLAPVEALLDLAQTQMTEHGCNSLQIHLAGTQGELVKRLRSWGLRHSGVIYSTAADTAARQPNA